jgi:hypothetical protein
MTKIGRREAIAGTVLVGAGTAVGASARSAGDEEALLRDVREELRGLRAQLSTPPAAVQRVRAVQQTFLRAAGKYPDFIEVGVFVFDGVHDWLRQLPHPVQVARMRDGRYGLQFDFTTLVLRTDMPADFVGPASDTR